MHYEKFIGQVQHRARLATVEQAVTAIRATMTTLAVRLTPGEVQHLAAQLPREIAFYLRAAPLGPERMSLADALVHVSNIEHVPITLAAFHACAVVDILKEAVSPGAITKVLAQLPAEFAPLFAVTAETARSTT